MSDRKEYIERDSIVKAVVIQQDKERKKWVIHKCSLCGYSNGRKQSNYCPNCGAKMDGKENNDDNT